MSALANRLPRDLQASGKSVVVCPLYHSAHFVLVVAEFEDTRCKSIVVSTVGQPPTVCAYGSRHGDQGAPGPDDEEEKG